MVCSVVSTAQGAWTVYNSVPVCLVLCTACPKWYDTIFCLSTLFERWPLWYVQLLAQYREHEQAIMVYQFILFSVLLVPRDAILHLYMIFCLSTLFERWPQWLSRICIRLHIRLVIRRWRVQYPQDWQHWWWFFLGDWSWNIFYSHSLPSTDSRKAVVSSWCQVKECAQVPLRTKPA